MKLTVSLLVALTLGGGAFAQNPDLAAIQTLIRQGRTAEAKPLAQAAVQANPQNAQAQDLLGQALTRSEKPSDAIAPLTTATTLDPKNAAAFTHLGDAQIARFMISLRDWVKDHSHDLLGMVNHDVPTVRDGGPDTGAILFTEERINDRSSSQMTPAEWMRFEAIAKSARDAYSKALAIAPDDKPTLRGKGLSQLILGEWKETVTDFQTAGVPVFDPFVYDLVASIHDSHAMGEESIRLWTMVSRSEPLNAWAYWDLRKLYNEFHRGDWHFDYYDAMRMLFSDQISNESDAHKPTVKDGLKALRALTEKHGDEAIVWRGIGIASAMSKDKKGAEEAFKKSVELDATDWYSNFQYGAYRLAAKDSEAAQPLLQAAVKAQPDNAMAWHALGSAAEKNKDLDTAVAAYERATEISPSWAQAHLSAGALLLDRRQGAEALPHLERYLELSPKAADADEIRTAIKQVKEILAKQG
ncbi:MAG TPA: tetratricopeptide repeat protein [Armatimonadota bacterium]